MENICRIIYKSADEALGGRKILQKKRRKTWNETKSG
jgi:hypothetical protein